MPDKFLVVKMQTGGYRVAGQYGGERRYTKAYSTKEEAVARGQLLMKRFKITKAYEWAA